MKIKLLSDLHLEFAPYEISNDENNDILILAGDIFLAQIFNSLDTANIKMRNRFTGFIEKCCDLFPRVIMIAGNHEYYRGDYNTARSVISSTFTYLPNFKFMDNETLEYMDHVIYAGTMWTDYNGENVNIMNEIVYSLNDYRLIRNFGTDVVLAEFKDFFTKFPLTDKPLVVVTHHAPHPRSINVARYGLYNNVNHAYYQNLEEFILDNPNIKIWAHGHTHSTSDYMIGDTNVIANPRGYNRGGDNENLSFLDDFSLKI